jgi:DNA-binding PadR family transcriptional regulator
MNHSFNTYIAKNYGIECAIILENIYFWCKKNEANGHLTNGEPWTYNSVKAFNELFDYLSASAITRALKKLEENGLIKTGCFNTNSYDRTKWYCITDKAKEFFDVCNQQKKSDESICQNGEWNNQNEKSNSQKEQMNISDINTDNKPFINTDTSSKKMIKESKKTDTYKNSDYQRVIDAYYENCNILCKQGLFDNPHPALPDIGFLKKKIKKAFDTYGVEAVVSAVKESINHKWLVEEKNYAFTCIFGPVELPNLINKTYDRFDKSKQQSKQHPGFDKKQLDEKYDFDDITIY